jgi:hypothetical protein
MTDEVKTAVLAVLRRSQHGFAQTHGSSCSTETGLPWWKRAVNRLTKKFGGDTPPFTDPVNYWKVEELPLSCVANESLIHEAMRELAPESKCRRCGGTNLDCDPAGYYQDALDYNGAPLLCLDCHH